MELPVRNGICGEAKKGDHPSPRVMGIAIWAQARCGPSPFTDLMAKIMRVGD